MTDRRARFRGRWSGAATLVAVGVLVGCGPPPPDPVTPDATGPITAGDGGTYGDASALGASTSADGVWTAYSSNATNLVAGDTNGTADTFLRNNATGTVTRIVEGTVEVPKISRNGRYVGFQLASGPGLGDYGVHDRVTGTSTTWSDLGQMGSPAVTDDGGHAVHGAGGSFGVFAVSCRVRDLSAGSSSDCPHGGPGFGTVTFTGLSANAEWVLYYWNDQNGGGTSGWFLLEVATGAATPLAGTFVGLGVSSAVSDDGTTILAGGFGASLPLSLYDVVTGTSTLMPGPPDGNSAVVGFSPDGRYGAVVTEATNLDPADTNGAPDTYVWDQVTGNVTLVSRAFDTGAVTTAGVNRCAPMVGQVLADGRVCVLAAGPMSATDTNSATDAFLVPGP